MSEQIVHFNKLSGDIKIDTSEITYVNGIADKTMDIIIEYIKKNNYKLKVTDNSHDDQIVTGINRNKGEKRFNIKIEDSQELMSLSEDISYIMDIINNKVIDLVIENNLEHTKKIKNHSAEISVITSNNGDYNGWSDPYPAGTNFGKYISDDGYPLYAVNIKISRY